MTRCAAAASRLADLFLVVIVLGIVVLAALPHVAPRLGYDPLVIRGKSMQPAIAIGSVVFVRHVPAEDLRVGDVISVHATNGVVYTHRITSIRTNAEELQFQTQGDANEDPDAVLVPASALVGRVEGFVPGLGYLLVLFSTTKGMLLALSLGLFSFLVGRFTADIARRPLVAGPTTPAPAAVVAAQ
jgi:signal peptidase